MTILYNQESLFNWHSTLLSIYIDIMTYQFLSLKFAKYLIMIGYSCLECREAMGWDDGVVMMVSGSLMIMLCNVHLVMRLVMQACFCHSEDRGYFRSLLLWVSLCSNPLRKLLGLEKLRYMGHSFLAHN